jgi:polysaccharide deacetylase family protein (PEP-CTERM system associated)
MYTSKQSQNPLPNAFTVDLEDWFQGLTSTNPQVERWPEFESRVELATDNLLALLRNQQVKATFFVLGYVADRHPELIERIVDDGHEIGVHGYYHRFVYQLTPDEFANELELSIAAVERITGRQPLGHRAPYFSINGTTPWAFSIMQSHGIQYDSSVFPTRNMLYGYPGAPRYPYRVDGTELIEFPASTVRAVGVTWPIAGGFYTRALPYSITRWAMDRLHSQDIPAVMYVHPWELDTGQTYSEVTARERVTHYHGRRALETKLNQLLNDYEFTTLDNVRQLWLQRQDKPTAADGQSRRNRSHRTIVEGSPTVAL